MLSRTASSTRLTLVRTTSRWHLPRRALTLAQCLLQTQSALRPRCERCLHTGLPTTPHPLCPSRRSINSFACSFDVSNTCEASKRLSAHASIVTYNCLPKSMLKSATKTGLSLMRSCRWTTRTAIHALPPPRSLISPVLIALCIPLAACLLRVRWAQPGGRAVRPTRLGGLVAPQRRVLLSHPCRRLHLP
jgi:hypothetical protein